MIQLGHAQDWITEPEAISIPKYEIREGKEQTIYLPSPFAEPHFSNRAELEMLQYASIRAVKLVFTSYRQDQGFDQVGLNQQRLNNLYKLVPQLKEDYQVRWSTVSQTGCTSPQEGRDHFFHGFEIVYEPADSQEELDKEIAYLEYLLQDWDNLEPPHSGVVNPDKELEKPKKKPDSTILDIKTRWDDVIGYVHDTIWGAPEVQVKSAKEPFDIKEYEKNVLIQVFTQNPDWGKMLIVLDMTGSMSPYWGPLAKWIKINGKEGRFSHFVFFNDGDGKPRRKKVIGSTGGIYTIPGSEPMRNVLKLALKARRNGYGNSEVPENDIEGVLKALEICPECKEVFLIADNWSGMRDYQLMKQINKPVHIIPCGAFDRVNVAYLDLARATKGAIHTPQGTLKNLHLLESGQTIEFQKLKYRLVRGRFHPVREKKQPEKGVQ